jgi:hypothetical protein
MTDKELLAKCLEFLEHGYGDIYRKMLIDEIKKHIRKLDQ